MDALYPSESCPRKAPAEKRRWNYDEESQLIRLIEIETMTYEQAAKVLNRTAHATQHRYAMIRQRDVSATINWTPELDAAVIDGHRRMQKPKAISREMNIPVEAIQSRWQALKVMKKVPQDVIDLQRRKKLCHFTPEDDEAILHLYVEGKEDKELAQMLKIKGKSQTEVINRRRKLVAESSPIYRRLVNVRNRTLEENGVKVEKEALEVAVGRDKYEWMEEGT
ncbi:uncharacterized protein J4E79_003074 [Alternaria viburni]|uniref:uncharacterized protein n=1 Tax=Alternaria viburni TaxID=566460 RepID=UPI0020C5474A|nr:uncharacterized protein J4E79_003074 [Alternaria viburni]KAI4664776.1 hypothetical protein J4E79_003074 [Alternaria viburni]